MGLDITGLGSLFDFGSKLIDKLIPDPAQKSAAALELAKLQQSGDLALLASETELLKGQLDINKVEAASTNMFIAGWRPFIGWVCGCAFVYAAIGFPLAQFVATLLGYKGPFPALDTGTLVSVLMGMLGLGGMRTFEKWSGSEARR